MFVGGGEGDITKLGGSEGKGRGAGLVSVVIPLYVAVLIQAGEGLRLRSARDPFGDDFQTNRRPLLLSYPSLRSPAYANVPLGRP